MNFLPAAIEEYAERHTSPETGALRSLNKETHRRRGDSVMLSGHLQGAVLQMISRMLRPRRVLEIGTYTGYSAICLAQGLPEGGLLHTIEIDEELYDIAHRYISEAGCAEKIVQHTGAATDIIPALDESFDLVFIDADKSNYSRYLDLAISKTSVGGWIMADNVLYDGEVVWPEDEQSKNGRAIVDFNRKAMADTRLEKVLLPIRDGLMVMRKLSD